MIATGLIFLLGALVALLLALLFVPLLWRNAQRLARRDFAATMPATMSEIRAEVDRVRAEAALAARRQEMLVHKARERLALERAEVGRLSAAGAKMALASDQQLGEANVLRSQIADLQAKAERLDAERERLEGENAELKETVAEALAEAREMEERIAAAGRAASMPPSDATEPAPDSPAAAAAREETENARVAAATSALLALAREQRRGRAPAAEPSSRPAAAPAEASPAAASVAANAPVAPAAGRSDTAAAPAPAPREAGGGHRQVVDELRALAASPRPSDAAERDRQNAQVREHIADVAARIIQLTALKEGPDSRTAALLGAEAGERAGATTADGQPTLAERVRRLAEPRGRPAPRSMKMRSSRTGGEAGGRAAAAVGAGEAAPVRETPAVAAEPAAAGLAAQTTAAATAAAAPAETAGGDAPAPSPSGRAKRKRGATRSQPNSPR